MSFETTSRQLLLALKEARERIEDLERARTEPIAIIGMACRFPGGAHDPESFWRLLQGGKDAIREIPFERWNVEAFYDPDPEKPGKMYTRYGGFLDEIDRFDPQFFGIAPREATGLDPQHRLLLEVSWEALERAGHAPQNLVNSLTGVFIGITSSEYSNLVKTAVEYSSLAAHGITGLPLNASAGRLSYTLGLTGPAMAIDTACSSSLVSIHLACQSLRQGECHLALAGGVNLILLPDSMIMTSKARMLSPDGRCKTFDAAADGIGRGEGCGMLVLKRLRDAQADRENILAVILGSAVNQDGPSSGFTVPNASSQQDLIRCTLAQAGVVPSLVSYVEAHGTGTSLGDPIELRSLGLVYGQGRAVGHPLRVGSVKTNLGHLESAAGVAGLIKVVLQLQHREIAPHLHFRNPTPNVKWEELAMEVPAKAMPWSGVDGRLLAGVSAFGGSGTNAHLVVAEAPLRKFAQVEVERPLHVLTLSAKNAEALRELAGRYERHLTAQPSESLADVCFTANAGRSHFFHRVAVVTQYSSQVATKLGAFVLGETPDGVIQGEVKRDSRAKVAFLFTGQGSLYVGMGRQLYETQPTFRRSLERCTEMLRPYLEQPLLDVLYFTHEAGSLLHETAYAQAALFALEYALTELWQSWGITPAVVMGHSVGEYVAACVAGVFSVEDGLKLIAERGRLMQALPQDGEMVAVFAEEVRVAAACRPYASEVSIAAINGPQHVVISGCCQRMQQIVAALEAGGVRTQKLPVSHAFHSPLMEPMLREFERVASELTYHEARIALVSNVSGEVVRGVDALYWVRHVREAVRFEAGMKALQAQGCSVYLEVGPSATLVGMGRQCVTEGEALWVATLRKGRGEWRQVLESLAELYTRGVEVDWAGFDRPYGRRRVVLPTYPFQRDRYWVETDTAATTGVQQALELAESPITRLLSAGDTAQLARAVESAGRFSQDEIKLLPKVMDVLVREHRQQATAEAVKDWLYEVQWQAKRATPAIEGVQAHRPGLWLIFADRGGVGQSLAGLLQGHSRRYVVVEAGEEYAHAAAGRLQINPASPADYTKMFEEVLDSSGQPITGVVYLWSLDTVGPEMMTLETLEIDQRLSCGGLLHLVQALGKAGLTARPRLWVVTRGAVPAGGNATPLSVAQSAVWGLGKVVALEYPDLWGGLLDLAPEAVGDEAGTLMGEVEHSDGEDQVAYRDGQRYVARLVNSQPGKAAQVQFKIDSTYLITGGLGSLGLQVAEWLVAHGVRHLMLMGRRGAATEVAQAPVRRWQEAGVQVCVAQADVAQINDLHRVFTEIRASMPPLRGVVHAAGILDDGILMQQQWMRFAAVMAPKVAGAWNLHLLTQELKLDHFVLFSSAASVLAATGQGNYAAANAFLDALAHYRRAQGLPGMSINWGPWAEVGMAATDRIGVRLAAQGIEALTPPRGLAALGQVLEHPVAQIGVLPIDWPKFLSSLPVGEIPPFLRQIAPGRSSDGATSQAGLQRADIVEQLEQAASGARWELLLAYLQREVSQVLGFVEAQPLEPQQGFFDLGMDSLMAVELKNRLQRSLGRPLPTPIAFDYPSVEALGRYLVKAVLPYELFSGSAEDSPQEEDERAQFAATLANLAPDEIAGLLAQELAAIDRDKVE